MSTTLDPRQRLPRQHEPGAGSGAGRPGRYPCPRGRAAAWAPAATSGTYLQMVARLAPDSRAMEETALSSPDQAGPGQLWMVRERWHGYQLLERLPELSFGDGAHRPWQPVPPAPGALAAEGLVSSQWQDESGPPRRDCRLTAPGAQLLDSWRARCGT